MYVTWYCIAHRKFNGKSPPELGSPDVWAGGGIGLIAGLLLRYVLVRVLVVFKLFGRTWTLDLKDNDHTDPR